MGALHDQLQRELDTYAKLEGEDLLPPGSAIPVKCLVSGPSLESEFLPGAEILNNAIRVRVSRTVVPTDPALQTTWTLRGKTWRLAKVEPHKTSIMLTLEDLNN
jgi:hypothetical protein